MPTDNALIQLALKWGLLQRQVRSHRRMQEAESA